MGYRSDVRVILSKEDFDKYVKGKIDDSLEKNMRILFENEEKVLFKWDDIKWYEDLFPEIQQFMDILDLIDSDDKNNYYFARKGEDVTDIEERSNYWEDFPYNLYSFDDGTAIKNMKETYMSKEDRYYEYLGNSEDRAEKGFVLSYKIGNDDQFTKRIWCQANEIPTTLQRIANDYEVDISDIQIVDFDEKETYDNYRYPKATLDKKNALVSYDER